MSFQIQVDKPSLLHSDRDRWYHIGQNNKPAFHQTVGNSFSGTDTVFILIVVPRLWARFEICTWWLAQNLTSKSSSENRIVAKIMSFHHRYTHLWYKNHQFQLFHLCYWWVQFEIIDLHWICLLMTRYIRCTKWMHNSLTIEYYIKWLNLTYTDLINCRISAEVYICFQKSGGGVISGYVILRNIHVAIN